VLIANDVIAGILNRNRLVTGYGNRWTRERVTSLRSHHRIPVYKSADYGIEPWLNLATPLDFSMLPHERSGWQRRLARLRRFILCQTVLGS
jgi:hypothetical protein